MPEPGADQVRLRLQATSVNASDLELLTGVPAYGRADGPFRPRTQVLGSDVAGIVDAVGDKVDGLAPGDAVFGDAFDSFGGFAEMACVPANRLTRKPESLSFEVAAALPQSGLIALQGLRDVGQLKADQRLLVNGAGGGGGSFAVQLGKHWGAEVTAVDNAEKGPLLRSLGADLVVDYATQDVTVGATRYDLILDLAGGHSIFEYRRILAPGGRYLLVGGAVKHVLQNLFVGGLLSLVTRKRMGLLFHRPNVGLTDLLELVERGAVTPIIDRTFPLEQTPAALRYLADGHAKGKVVITM